MFLTFNCLFPLFLNPDLISMETDEEIGNNYGNLDINSKQHNKFTLEDTGRGSKMQIEWRGLGETLNSLSLVPP